jgi:predicted nucleic acid-binding Zn ribbon protein
VVWTLSSSSTLLAKMFSVKSLHLPDIDMPASSVLTCGDMKRFINHLVFTDLGKFNMNISVHTSHNKHCVQCNKLLINRQKMYCSAKCKYTKSREKYTDNSYQRTRGKERKQKLVELMGGKCSLCGYSKCLRALHFHHKDSSTKSFSLDSRILSGRS